MNDKDIRKKINEAKPLQDRVYQIGINNFGLKYQIVKYVSQSDISVLFLDDQILIEHTTYDKFLKGSIENPNNNHKTKLKKERIGKRFQTNSGLWIEIIDYIDYNHVTIKFESDGSIRNNVIWSSIQKGCVSHPSKVAIRDKTARIGEIRMMNNGLEAIIVDYRNASDMDIVFMVDETKVCGVPYCRFKDRTIAHPQKTIKHLTSMQEFAINYYLKNYGFVKIKKGEWKNRGFGLLELDFYNKEANVAIEYDGGVHNYAEIQKRDINKNIKCKELGLKLYRLREPHLAILNDGNSINCVLEKQKTIFRGLIDCGLELKRILSENNIDFEQEDFDFVKDAEKIRKEFEETCIDYYAKTRVGEQSYCKKANQTITITAYHSSDNVDIVFEDGTQKYGITYAAFKDGRVRHPQNSPKRMADKRSNEIKTMNNGLRAQIINYRQYNDIDVKFLDDDTVVEHTDYYTFSRGTLGHPKFNPKSLASQRIGEFGFSKNGEKIKIIGYRNTNDIDILYVDENIIKEHVSYSKFKKQLIPGINKKNNSNSLKEQRLKERRVTTEGYEVEIVEYRNVHDIDVMFLIDGTMRYHIDYKFFKNGTIKYKDRKTNKTN